MTSKPIFLFLSKILPFLALVGVLDFGIGTILEKLYFYVPRKLTYALNDSNEDILIYGSSRANRHYNPEVFEEELGLTCFNNGLDGRNIFYNYALLASATERYTPKIVILDLLSADYSETGPNWGTDRLDVLLPFYRQSQYIDEVINLRSDYEEVKLLSQIYPYNSAVVDIVKTWILEKDLSIGYQGYLPAKRVSGMKNEMHFVDLVEPLSPDSLKISYLQKFIRICNDKDIELIIILSPWYCQEVQNAPILEEFAATNHVPFWNLTFHEDFSDSAMFSDESHLNEMGANNFSEMIANKIRMEIL